ncbi:allergen Tha p 1-like [Contarinia nasturtii]|uniref:allergen Tha p 1-like n=1 Tax=Contarinia nasturtii TaxID=265458 RepID=UPI0012D422C3|nr:allergen Tha p 1-like [Contarinia nasturtii]
MKSTLALVLLMGMVCLINAKEISETELAVILRNKTVVKSYIDCFLDKRTCSKMQYEFKVFLPEAIKNECRECTDLQRKQARLIINHMKTKQPQEWKQLLMKYDPQNLYLLRVNNWA